MNLFAGDRERLRLFRAGERSVLAEVYRHYLEPLARVLRQGFAVRIDGRPGRVPGLDSPFEIECACHEVFMRAFLPAARLAYDGQRPYANYLFRIARNWRIDQARKRTPALGIEADVEMEQIDEAPDADERLIDEQQRVLVRLFLDTLPIHERAYCRARFDDGLSQTDAALSLGMTRIQGRLIEARIKSNLVEWIRRADPAEVR